MAQGRVEETISPRKCSLYLSILDGLVGTRILGF